MIEHHDEIICNTERNNQLLQKYAEDDQDAENALNELKSKIDKQAMAITANDLTIETLTDMVNCLDTMIDEQHKTIATFDKMYQSLDVKLNLIITGNGPFYGCRNCSKFKDWINKLIDAIESDIKDLNCQYERLSHSIHGVHSEQMRISTERDRLIKQKKVYEAFFDELIEPKRMPKEYLNWFKYRVT
jgi:archaellum component FlaC